MVATSIDLIRLFKVYMSEEAPKAVSNVLMSGYIGEGPKVAELEQKLGSLIHNPNILCTNSGTSALMIALRCAGVNPGDVVISTPVTCLATNEAILAIGARIVWADVHPTTGMITHETLEGALREAHEDMVNPAAIMTMHWGGQVSDLWALNNYGIPVVEDACQALGSSYGGLLIGNHSFASCFSFQAIKTLTTGDGGAIAFRDPASLERARLMKWFGLDRTKSSDMRCNQNPPELGYKAQMNDIAAAIGLANIRIFPSLIERMKEIGYRYDIVLNKHPYIERVGSVCDSSNWLFTILVDDSADFIAYMRTRGIECSKVHDRNDTKKIFKPFSRPLPGVSAFNNRHVCIPCGWWLTDDDVETIIKALVEYENG